MVLRFLFRPSVFLKTCVLALIFFAFKPFLNNKFIVYVEENPLRLNNLLLENKAEKNEKIQEFPEIFVQDEAELKVNDGYE